MHGGSEAKPILARNCHQSVAIETRNLQGTLSAGGDNSSAPPKLSRHLRRDGHRRAGYHTKSDGNLGRLKMKPGNAVTGA